MTGTEVLRSVRKAIRESEAVAASRALSKACEGKRSVLFGKNVKPISVGCIAALEAQGCECADWGRVLVKPGFDPVNVRNVRFVGDVLLGFFEGEVELADGVSTPAGIQNAVISNCEIGDGCLIRDVGLLANYVVNERAIVWRCGTVTTRTGSTFGNGRELKIAIETGGRELLSFAEITVAEAETVCRSRGDKKFLAEYAKAVGEYAEAVRSDVGTIGAGARVCSTPVVIDAFVGAGAVIENATRVEGVTMLSTSEERTKISDGALVRNTVMQWGCEASSMAIMEESILAEHSHVERHGKVTQSVLGPNTSVAEGEVTASLVGPFVGFHHQALLIGALWPEGKGNVGYGANVGSNHTGKAPDQEIWPGEGMFFGLGASIKFPSDFSRAPYSIVATGVNTLPQKVTFPFSLINTPAANIPGISPAYNEIIPAWVLSDSLYTVRRNEEKFLTRNRARRSQFEFEVIRAEIAEMMMDARERLAGGGAAKDIYTDEDIAGLGKNYLTDANRMIAIATYTFYIRYYALKGLKARLESEGRKAAGTILTKRTGDRAWEHQRRILAGEFGADADAIALLTELGAAEERIARDTQESKEKDDRRGARIIEDYAEAHGRAAEDALVKETWAAARKAQREIQKLAKPPA